MNAPDPKANTTTEAYLAYKAGYLEESELKPKLYEPYLHFDAWLAYWAGLTNEYPLDKNGDPEMLTDEEALVAYLAGVTDTYPEEIKDPYDVRIVGYLKHLASIRWPEPDYPVNNEEFYLSTMEPTHTSNSEPSADIELDTAEGKIIGVEAYGDTFQQTYSGKNLLRNTFNSPSTVSGVTFTKNPDGTITANGTATEGLNFYPNGNDYYPISEGTYTLSDGLSNPTSTAYFTYIDTNTSAPNYIYFNTAEGTVTRTLSEGITIKPRIVIRQGQTLDNVVFKLMLEQGSTATAFEPYVGGIPAPNPDYPQNVQVVTGEQTVTVTGKNIVNLQGYSSSGVTSSINGDGSITISGTATSSGGVLVMRSQQTLKAGTYTMTISRPLPFLINLAIASGVSFRIPAGGTNVTTTLPEDYIGGGLYMAMTAGTTYNETFNLQVVAGSTPDYDFETYHLQSYTVDLGPIELCSIGNYQDKIFNNDPNEDWYDPDLEDNAWYVHKECGGLSLAIADMDNSENFPGWKGLPNLGTDLGTGINEALSGRTSYYTNITNFIQKGIDPLSSPVSINTVGANRVLFLRAAYFNKNQTDWKTNYPNLTFEIRYTLATATDTKITDTTLVGQLDALAGADTYNEKTYIEVTATDPNLPALLKVEAYKY